MFQLCVFMFGLSGKVFGQCRGFIVKDDWRIVIYKMLCFTSVDVVLIS